MWFVFSCAAISFFLIWIWNLKWHWNWASVANIPHTSKISSNRYVHQDWCKTSRKFWENDQNPEFWGVKSGPKIRPLRPIFCTHLKVLAIRMWSNINVNSVKTFWESDQTPEFWLTLGLINWAFEAHVLLISESSSNQHIKRDWCESRAKCLTKYSKTWIFTHLQAQNGPKFGLMGPVFCTPKKSRSNELVNQVFNPAKPFQENIRKAIYWPISAKFGAKNGPTMWPNGVIFYTSKSTHNMPLKASWSRISLF